MKVIVQTPLSNEERAQLSAWAFAHQNDHVRYVTVDAGSVVVHGRHPRHPKAAQSGAALRHTGQINLALDKAFGRLRNNFAV
jgi:hypothetical protein